MKLLFFWTVTLLTVTDRSLHAWLDPTRGGSGVDLSGKMFTLSGYNGGLVIYSPYQPSPWSSPTPYHSPSSTQTTTRKTERPIPSTTTQTTTSAYRTTEPTTQSTTERTTEATTTRLTTIPQSSSGTTERTTKPTTERTTDATTTTYPWTTHPWTTNPTTRGVSVCLRYITDSQSGSIFTLRPTSNRLRLEISEASYVLNFRDYYTVVLQPNIRLWSDLRPNMWTSICLTVDNMKGVVQMFRDSDMSSRKLLTYQYIWSGEPVIDFTNFEGQVTDIQVWDYPLCYKEVLYYMSSGYYGLYQGSALNWSNISYSLRGRTLLEESYELQMKKPNRKRQRGHHLKQRQNPRKLFPFEESKRKQWKNKM
ncbi:uncharacterized protein FYW61_002557 [Anableps anableps]